MSLLWKRLKNLGSHRADEHARGLISRFIDACNEAADHIEALESELSGVRAGTHQIVPVEPTDEMTVQGLVGLCEKIEKTTSRPPKDKPFEQFTDEELANYYMSVGAIMRNGNEVNSCWSAMLTAAAKEGENG